MDCEQANSLVRMFTNFLEVKQKSEHIQNVANFLTHNCGKYSRCGDWCYLNVLISELQR